MAERLQAVLLAGPTASGKSALALALAERFGGIVVNADSMQVYADLAILTARPAAAGAVLEGDAGFVAQAAERVAAWRAEGAAAWQARREAAQAAFGARREEHAQRLQRLVGELCGVAA